MKKALGFIAAFAWLVGTPALAADIALKAPPPPPPPVLSWTGFYVGADVGGAWMTSTANWLPLPSPAGFGVNPITARDNASSFAGGVHLGYDWQFSPLWVGGVEGDWMGTHAAGSFAQPWTTFGTATPIGGTFTTTNSTLNDLFSIRAKLGVLASPSLMLYATGGGAWGEVHDSAIAADPPPGSGYFASTSLSRTGAGYVVGGGAEWAITNNWLARIQYLYYHLNTGESVVANAPAFPAFPSSFTWSNTNVSLVTVGLSYKFSGPVVASY
jgi:outer membrane immunogenic protein